jgi:hypothetical protein
MLVVNVVQREHGAAVEQELGRERLVAEVFERDAERGLGLCGEDGDGGKKKKPSQSGAEDGAGRCRDGGVGNQHGTRRVSTLSTARRSNVSQTHERRQRVHCDGRHGARDGQVVQRLDNSDVSDEKPISFENAIQKQRREADFPFGFAQGRLFGNDNKKSRGKSKGKAKSRSSACGEG